MMAATDEKQFTLQKVIASNMLPSFPIGTKATRIGLILYGSRFRKIVFNLKDHSSTADVKSKLVDLQNLPTNDYVTFSSIASSLKASFEDATRVLSAPSLGARSDAAKRIILFTPSNFFIPETLFENLMAQNIQVVMMKLASFSSKPEDVDKKGINTGEPKTPKWTSDHVTVINFKPIGSNVDLNDDIRGNNLDNAVNAIKPGI